MASLPNWVSNPSETHGPLMSAGAWSMLGVSAAFLFVRLYIRQSQGKLWLDDLALGISWVLLLVQAIINQLTINLGFGKHALDVDFSNLERIAYYGATSLSVSIIAITLSKISFGITLLRLTITWPRYYVWFAMATLAIFAVPVAVIPWVQCKPLAKTFADILPGKCIDKHPSVVYGRFQAVWSAIMDISLALLPWHVLWKLQMQLAEKIGVCVAMSLGILAGATAIVRARYVELLTKQDLSYDAYNTVLWSFAETAMTIVATSIPVLRVFLKQAVTSVIESYNNSSGRSGNSRINPENTASTFADVSKRRMSKRRTDTNLTGFTNISKESLVETDRSTSKGYLELDDLTASESIRRVPTATPESMNPTEQHVSQWPLGRETGAV
ncbi:hypothetical protein HBI73_208890 [Parastagonospora nodorum]|nr:hypothetical protein HBI73_208890 [Parastagonospora nodorum]KAH5296150.1 hypothetical protein HBI12_213960 [Parastagonospora nodorum]KAH5346360.1 hypothetical protein HBI49_211560 [Parastagonospora nodorum]KAH5347560.1 hypothetical protein HBI33_222720 [Parastagonospora nodorum]KAH5397877.1 hypothetical protein HBI47_209630 [Parastagonospora nodorum]